MTLYLFALLMGVVAGLRAMTAPAAVSWAARLGILHPTGSLLSWLGFAYTPWIFTALALGELVSDQLPKTPSRKVPVQFATRILMGALCGAAIAVGASFIVGALVGALGAIIGTLGGAAFRARLAATFGKDPPAAFIEDAVAVGGAALLIFLLS